MLEGRLQTSCLGVGGISSVNNLSCDLVSSKGRKEGDLSADSTALREAHAGEPENEGGQGCYFI